MTVRQRPPSGRLPLKRALFWIFLSTVLVSGSAVIGWFAYQTIDKIRESNPTFLVRTVVQTGPEREALRTAYLCELLELSQDCPVNLYSFDLEEAKARLVASPVIKTANIKVMPSDTVYIDYSVYTPVAYLHEYTNTAIDSEGTVMPIVPLISEKRLPTIYLGLPFYGHISAAGEWVDGLWGKRLVGPDLEIALGLLSLLQQPQYQELFQVVCIDVSQALAPSYGKREVVVTLEERRQIVLSGKAVTYTSPRVLRLAVQDLPQQLGNYLQLRPYLVEQDIAAAKGGKAPLNLQGGPVVVDMRIPHLAFLNFTSP